MKLEFLVLLCSVTAILAAPMRDMQDKEPGSLSLSLSSKALLETLGLGALSVCSSQDLIWSSELTFLARVIIDL